MSRKLRPDRVALLISRFPAAMSITNRRPLMLGVREQIIAAGLDMPLNHFKHALAEYCGQRSYQAALVEGAMRVDLGGNPAGTVTASEAAHAVDMRASIEQIPAPPTAAPATDNATSISTILPISGPALSSTGRLGLADLKAAATRRRRAANTSPG